jgi:hypothetical protein
MKPKEYLRVNKTAIEYLLPSLFSFYNNDRKIYISIEDFSGMLDYAKTLEQIIIEQAYRDGAKAGALSGKYIGTSARDYYEQNFKSKSVCEHYLASKGGNE